MFKIKKKISKLAPYPLTSQKVYQKKCDRKLIKLDWNEFPYNPSPNVIKNIKQIINSKSIKLNWYPNTYPEELLAKIASYNNVKIENICLFSGSDSGLELIAKTFIENNTSVGIVVPTYDQFRIECIINSAKLIKISLKDIFNLDFDELNNKLKKLKPKILYLAHPNNPTGSSMKSKDLIKLIKIHNNILFIIDEAYIEYSKLKSLGTQQNLNSTKNLIIMRTFSKCFGLASLRIGYSLTSKLINFNLNKVKNHKSINSIAQLAGLSTFENISYYKKKIKLINVTKNKFVKKLKNHNISVINTPANFVLIKSKKKNELIEFLEKREIFIRNLNHLKFMQDYVRISIGTVKDMKFVADCIIKFFKNG